MSDTPSMLSSSNQSADNDQESLREHKNANSQRERLLTNESFELLRQFQEEVFAISEMTPSFRKVINALITGPNLKALKAKFTKSIDD